MAEKEPTLREGAADPREEDEKPRRSAPGGGFSRWLHTVFEAGLGFGILVLAEMHLGDGPVGSYLDHPHPYWLVVIPMAAARGVAAALFAATIATCLYLFGAWQVVPHGGDIHAFLVLKTVKEPLLFYAVGFLVGEFRDISVARKEKQARVLAEVRDELATVREHREVLTAANRILEKRMVNQTTQFASLLSAATRIESAGRRDLFGICLELIEEHVGAASSVLLPLENGSVDFICHRGWPDDEEPRRLEAARKSEFVQRALDEGRDVNAFSLEESPPEEGPLVVSPLIGNQGVIEALLCLDEIPKSRLNTQAVRTFFAIGEWISAALSRIEPRVEEIRPTATVELLDTPTSWIGNEADLGYRLVSEFERCTRYGAALSTLTLQFTQWMKTAPDANSELNEHVRMTFTQRIRSSDGVYRFPHPGCYVMILPGTPVEGAEAVKVRMNRRVQHDAIQRFGEVAIHASGPDPDAPDAQSFLERMTKRFRDEGALPMGAKTPMGLPAAPRVHGLQDFVRALRGEVNLCTRNDWPLQIVAVGGDAGEHIEPGLLALHVRQVAGHVFRASDTCYAVAPSLVAAVLPLTEYEDAEIVLRRLLGNLNRRDPDPTYGVLGTTIMSFGPKYPWHGAFLETLSSARPLKEVQIAGDEQ